MKPKTAVAALLLLFVAASIAYLVAKEAGRAPGPTGQAADQAASAHSGTDNAPGRKVVVYYFHGNVRCVTCKTIEAYAGEAVQAGFPDALEDGRLEWRPVNVDEPANEHYVQDFQLVTRSVVIEEAAAGKQVRWKNLQRVWELVPDKDAFLEYVQDETRVFLEPERQ
jgi:hypothetical protein